MCLSVPAKVVSICGDKADVDVGGVIYNASLYLVEDIKIGDFLLIHSGYAIQKIDKKEAEETLKLFKEIQKKS